MEHLYFLPEWRGSGEAFVLYVHFCMHYRKWFCIFAADEIAVADQYRDLCNPPEWLEFLAQDSHLTAPAGRIFISFFVFSTSFTLDRELHLPGVGFSRDLEVFLLSTWLSHIYLTMLLLNVSLHVLPLSLGYLSLSMCSFKSMLSLSLSLISRLWR